MRARSTVELAIEAGGWRCPLLIEEALYLADPKAVVTRLRAVEDGMDPLLIAGHEPCWSSLIALLTGGVRIRMPTAAVGCLILDGPGWSATEPGGGELQWLVTPRLLKPLL